MMNIITTPQAAELLSVHVNSAARLLDNAGVKYFYIGQARAYNVADIERISRQRQREKAK
jgi:N-acetylmuramoyl-L-alanine amidase